MNKRSVNEHTDVDEQHVAQRVLVVDDDEGLNRIICRALGRHGFHADGVSTGREALQTGQSADNMLMLLDYKLPDMTARELVAELQHGGTSPVFIVMTGRGDEKTAVDMMKMGARDYVVKHADFLNRLPRIVSQVFEELESERRLARAEKKLEEALEESNRRADELSRLNRQLAGNEQQLTASNQQLRSLNQQLAASEKELKASNQQLRASEQAVQESRARYMAVFEGTAEGILVADVETKRFKLANRAWCNLLGYGPDEVASLSVQDLHSSESLPHVLAEFEAQARGEKQLASEIPCLRKDGSVVYADINTAPVTLDGRPCNVGFFRDITERRIAEQKIRDLALFPSQNPDPVMRIAASGMLRYANDAALSMFDELRVDDHVGEPWNQFALAALQSGERRQEDLIRVQRSYTFSVVPIPEHGYVNLYGRNITDWRQTQQEKQRLEDQYKQSQKMEAIGQLAGGVAHDFNNSLGGIMGYADLLKLHLRDAPKLRGYVDRIVGSVSRASSLTQQLLSFARRGRMEIGPVDVNTVVANTSDMLRKTIDRRIGIRLELRAQPSLVRGDENQLANIFLNLALNARDAMPEGGRLDFSTERVVLKRDSFAPHGFTATPGDYIRVSVEDNGMGMTEDTKARLFEPFFTTKEMGKGTGLGLATTYGTIKQHGGYIVVESEPGKGSRFDVYLPRWEGAAKPAREKSLEIVRGGGRILVVDDEETVREAACDSLRELGYETVDFGNPTDAVEYYRTHHGELSGVVLDIIMPNMSGLQCFRALKNVNPMVRAVIVSGYSERGQSQAALAEGARAFVGKPFTVEELSAAVARAIAHDQGAGRPDDDRE